MKFTLPVVLAFFTICLFTLGSDEPSNRPMNAREVAATMQLPPGFKATCFASEPDVVEPIAFTIDTRGRLWVVESMAYPNWQKSGPGKDRVVILEDTDGDGVHDKRTVFLDNGRNLTGIELGFGGVWLLSAPEMLFIPVNEGEDKPAGPAKVLLDGWNTEIKHNIVSNLTWGMDGWLYGCHGITLKSKVGKPGTPDDQRAVFDCCIWRYHPTLHHFEVVCWGGTNPWGLDYDQYGTWFMTNCVIDHVFQVVPNAHYIRMFGSDPNPWIYHPLPGCADHKHWGGGKWTEGGRFDDSLGGHAHSGLMIYQEGNWPKEYQNQLYTLSIHGKRLQREKIDYDGPVAIARHQPDVLKVKDGWFMGVQAKAGPDGGVYIIDWSDTGECHSYVNTQRTTGRIYKVTYGKPEPWKKDLAKCSDAELVALHKEKGKEWHIRQARRLLQERAVASGGRQPPESARVQQLNVQPLFDILDDPQQTITARLRALWTLHACGAKVEYAKYWVNDQPERMRCWALRLSCDRPGQECNLPLAFPVDLELIAKDNRAVLMTMASVLPRLHLAKRKEAVHTIYLYAFAQWNRYQYEAKSYSTDTELLVTLVWNGIEEWIHPDTWKKLKVQGMVHHPLLLEWAVRKLVKIDAYDIVDRLAFEGAPFGHYWASILKGLEQSIEGKTWSPAWKRILDSIAPRPENIDVTNRCQEIAGRLGDPESLQKVATRFRTKVLPVEERARCLTILTQKPTGDLLPTVLELLAEPTMRRAAIKALARFDAEAVYVKLLQLYATATPDEKQDILATLSARPRYARALLDALDAKLIPAGDVLAPTVVTLRQLPQVDIKKRVSQRWGTGATPAALKERIARLQNQLTPATLRQADVKNGRLLFDKHCATCHKLFGEGTAIGPELTGAQRMNLDYLLENIVTPNAIVPQDYRATTFVLHSGRVLTGMITQKQGEQLTIQTATEKVTLAKGDIESQQQTDKSLMPEGLLDTLKPSEIRDLFGYLSSPQQVAK
ncbi:MAG: PVC-type heme-binding CxxCH protein [Gemmatales bacterium]